MVGSSDKRLYVRDAVSADVVLSRFLAPNDRGRLALSLHNIDGQAGEFVRVEIRIGNAFVRRNAPSFAAKFVVSFTAASGRSDWRSLARASSRW